MCECRAGWHQTPFDLCVYDEVDRLRYLTGDLAKQNTRLREERNAYKSLVDGLHGEITQLRFLLQHHDDIVTGKVTAHA